MGVFFCEAMYSRPKDLDELLVSGNGSLCETYRLEEFAFVGSKAYPCYHEDRVILEHHIATVKDLAEEITTLRADGHFLELGSRGEILARAARKLFGRRGDISRGDQRATSRITMKVERA